MGATTITLKDGLKVGDQVHKDVVLREIEGGDVIEAQEASEKLVQTATGPQLVSSPTVMSMELLRRQVASIGDIQGPVSLAELKKLSRRDLNALDRKAQELEAAVAADLRDAAGEEGGDLGR